MRLVITRNLQYASGAPIRTDGQRRETVIRNPGLSHFDLSNGDLRQGRLSHNYGPGGDHASGAVAV
jgi:hypothetical protein